MTEKWKNRLLLRGEFVAGVYFTLALMVVGVIVVGWGLPAAFDSAQKAAALGRQNDTQCQAVVQQMIELRSAVTVLYEFQPGAGLPVLEGLLEIRPGQSAEALLGPQGQTVVRWWIPAKVEPVVYGDGRGVGYAWVDVKNKKVEGPFAPQVQP